MIKGDKNIFKYAITSIPLLVMLSLQAYAGIDTIQTNVPALKDVYARDFTIGCLLSYPHIGFPSDTPVPGQSSIIDSNGGYLIRYHMNCMSPGNNMKAVATIRIDSSAIAYNAAPPGPERDSVNVHPVVRFNPNLQAQLNWARRQGFTFHGHTLVWHSQTPSEFFCTGYSSSNPRVTKAVMTERMKNYIGEVIRLLHEGWPGLVSAIDVVNEAINDDGTFNIGSEWYVTFGDSTFIMKAFEFARVYATLYGENQIKLYYNDYNTYKEAKADGIVRLLTPIFQAQYLDGIGMQEHDAISTPSAAQWKAAYDKYDAICTEMSVTELDVKPDEEAPSPATLAAQANQYAALFKCFVERSYRSGRGKIINVSKDGLNDRYAFKQNASLWDAQCQCKPAFYAAVNTGFNYYALDSLISFADTLKENHYTPESWAHFVAALMFAKNAKVRDYSATVSADSALGSAIDTLQAAIGRLIITGVANAGNIVKAFVLNQNYPNPFNPSTNISFDLPQKSFVSLKVFDLLGKEVAAIVYGELAAGRHSRPWNAASLSSGVYFCRLQAGSFADTKKLILMK